MADQQGNIKDDDEHPHFGTFPRFHTGIIQHTQKQEDIQQQKVHDNDNILDDVICMTI